jgi:hypothetical protein
MLYEDPVLQDEANHSDILGLHQAEVSVTPKESTLETGDVLAQQELAVSHGATTPESSKVVMDAMQSTAVIHSEVRD